jgi:hypothetical protein
MLYDFSQFRKLFATPPTTAQPIFFLTMVSFESITKQAG